MKIGLISSIRDAKNCVYNTHTQVEAHKSHICFFRKKQMSLTDERYDSRNSSRGPRSRICFFRKKQMPLTDDRYESRNTTRGPRNHICFFRTSAWASAGVSGIISVICEGHLLFPEKANVTSGPLLVFLDSYLLSVSDICFLRKKQM